MDYAASQRNPAKHLPSLTVVVILHLLMGYALVTGLARRAIDVIKQPIETKIIEEIKKPPPDTPPPPPPKLALPPPPFIPPPEINIQAPTQMAPTITTVTTTKPPPPPVAAPAPKPLPYIRKDFKPSTRIEPTFPRQALQQGLSGRVKAWMHVAPNGTVTEVEIKESSNSLFNREVVRALSQWKFAAEPVGFIVEQEIVFNLKD